MAAYSSIDERKSYLGGISVKVQTPDLTIRGREHLREFRRQMRAAHKKGLEQGQEILQDVLYEDKIFDTKTLINSVTQRLFIRTTDVFEGDVHFRKPGSEYAYFIEHGRSGSPDPAHRPPLDKMIAWGSRKGLTIEHVIAIRNKIGKRGITARPFMDKAARRIQINYDRIIDRAVEKFRTNDI